MTKLDARRWLLIASFVLTLVVFLLFALAPAIGLPVTWDQALRLMEIVLPVFTGYVGSITLLIIRRGRRREGDAKPIPLLRLAVQGPILIFTAAALAAIVGFAVSNGANATPGSGMSVDQLAAAIAAALSLLSVSTSVVMSYLTE